MQHIVNIAFDFDDETVKQHIEKNVEDSVINKISRNIEVAIFQKMGFGQTYETSKETAYRELVQNQVGKFLSEHKEEILQTTGTIMAERLCRTKAARELIGKAVEKNELI